MLVGDTTENTNGKWDTHSGDVFTQVQQGIAETDLGLSALLSDLRERGLLETTIVAWIAEFGRTPRMNGRGGRDHWPQCYSMLLAGGGFRGGQVFGSSDSIAAYPHDNSCNPAEIHATIHTLMGLPLDTTFTDALGRPYHLCDARPIRALI